MFLALGILCFSLYFIKFGNDDFMMILAILPMALYFTPLWLIQMGGDNPTALFFEFLSEKLTLNKKIRRYKKIAKRNDWTKIKTMNNSKELLKLFKEIIKKEDDYIFLYYFESALKKIKEIIYDREFRWYDKNVEIIMEINNILEKNEKETFKIPVLLKDLFNPQNKKSSFDPDFDSNMKEHIDSYNKKYPFRSHPIYTKKDLIKYFREFQNKENLSADYLCEISQRVPEISEDFRLDDFYEWFEFEGEDIINLIEQDNLTLEFLYEKKGNTVFKIIFNDSKDNKTLKNFQSELKKKVNKIQKTGLSLNVDKWEYDSIKNSLLFVLSRQPYFMVTLDDPLSTAYLFDFNQKSTLGLEKSIYSLVNINSLVEKALEEYQNKNNFKDLFLRNVNYWEKDLLNIVQLVLLVKKFEKEENYERITNENT